MGFKTDIEIAQECEMLPITEIAKTAGVENIIVEVEQYSYDVEKSVKLSLDYLLEAPFVKASYSK